MCHLCHLTSTLRSGKKIELLIYLDVFVDILNCETLPRPQSRAELVELFRIHFYCFCYPQSWWNSQMQRSCPLRKGPQAILSSTAPVWFFNWHQLRFIGAFCSFIFALGRIISDSELVDFLCHQHLFCVSYQFEALLYSSFGTFMSVLKPTLNRLVVLFPL